MQTNLSTSHKPDEAYWQTSELTANKIEIVSTPAPLDNFPTGKFKKGFDPRRHRFTREECSRGFWNAIESIIARYPHAIDKSGRHIACNFLRSCTEQAF